jgi:hypothetical protein
MSEADKKKSERASQDLLNFEFVTDFSEVSWYKPDHSVPYYRRIAEFMEQLAVRLPDHTVSLQMLGRVVEGLRTLPSEKSLVVRRVRSSIAPARKYMFERMPSKRMLIAVPHMGYVATSDDVHKQVAGVRAARAKMDRFVMAHAKYQDSVDPNKIPKSEKEIREEVLLGKRIAVKLELARAELQKGLDALKKNDL